MISRVFHLAALSAFLCCCQSPEEYINKFSDPVLVKIADLQDRREADSLYPYFTSENALHRRDAVRAFGSLQDSTSVDRLGKVLLSDADPSVREAAAFALGQTHHLSAVRHLLDALEKESSQEVIFEILQAYGKSTREWTLDPSAYMDDSTTAAGVAWALYRAGLRGKADPTTNGLAIRLLTSNTSSAIRLGAAHYFARGASDFRTAEKELTAAARSDESPEVRMAAASALGKIHSDSSMAALKSIIKNDKDPRVIANSLRALGSFPYADVKYFLYENLNHRDVNVAIAASEQIIAMVGADDWIEVASLTTQAANWRVMANLYEAALKAGRHPDLAKEIQQNYRTATDPYQKAAFIAALKHHPPARAFVVNELKQTDAAVVRSTAASTLVSMNHAPAFNTTLRGEFARTYKELMLSVDDPAVLGTIAGALADSTLGYRSILSDASFLYEARKKLQLPEHFESLQPLGAAIAYFENRRDSRPVVNEFNHPVNWDKVSAIPEGQRAIIKTSRGNITIRLLVNDSPGSVANFVDLAVKNYYDNKFVHRVVPNFVVQDGCERGDGWGGENYSIRSEFSPRRYRTGSIGMASAGKDTEGTQWFITHSPTPHLDGRYTIFAEVVDGMRVVDLLQVGDRIIGITLEHPGDN